MDSLIKYGLQISKNWSMDKGRTLNIFTGYLMKMNKNKYLSAVLRNHLWHYFFSIERVKIKISGIPLVFLTFTNLPIKENELIIVKLWKIRENLLSSGSFTKFFIVLKNSLKQIFSIFQWRNAKRNKSTYFLVYLSSDVYDSTRNIDISSQFFL